MSFNEKLQMLRKKNNLSQEELANMLDVTRQSVSKWESGITYPEMDKLLSLCKIFKCSLEELTNDDIKEIGLANKKKLNFDNFIDNTLGECKEFCVNGNLSMIFGTTIGSFFVIHMITYYF